jgi:aminoglycoside N3'-acetyltransferase
MPMKTTDLSGLCEHLAALGIKPGTNLLVQSRLISFGQIPGGAEMVYRALRQAVGAEATIAVPTYRLHSGGDAPFDRARSPSQEVGVLSELVRQMPGAVRSNCQMHSHAAVGPRAGIFDAVSGGISFGPGSDFEAMENADFHLLMLGCGFPIATFAIHLQAVHGAIPYRAWLDLPRPRVGPAGEIVPATCRYYARVQAGADEDLEIVGEHLRRSGRVSSAPCAYGTSNYLSLADFHRGEMQLLRANPEVLIQRPAP